MTFDILIIGNPEGRRARYYPPLSDPGLSIGGQIALARGIGWEPLYVIRVLPKPGFDWVVGLALAHRTSHAR